MAAVFQRPQVDRLEVDLDAAALGDVVLSGEGLAVHLHAREGVEVGAADEGEAHVAAVIVRRAHHGDGRAAVTAGDTLGDDGVGQGDLRGGGSVLVALAAAGAEPILAVALGLGGGRLGGHVLQVAVVGGVLLAVGPAAIAAGGRGGAAGRSAGVLGQCRAAGVADVVFVVIRAVLSFRVGAICLTGAGVGFVAAGCPVAPIVAERIAGEEGRLIRRALGAQTADCAGLVVNRLFRAGGGGFQVLCIHGLLREVVGQLFAIFRTANCACCSLGAGRRAAGVLRLMKHRAAGADLPVFRFVGFPVVALVVMGVALSIEHGQGLVSCGQILAFVCPRVSIVVAFASLEQLPHRAVGKFCGGLGVGSLDINTVRSAGWVSCRQIVAVIDSGANRAGQIAYNFAPIAASVQTADIITVGNQNIYVPTIRLTCDSTGVFAGDHSDIIAVTNCCVYSISVDLSSDSSADSTGAEGA